MNIDPDAEEPFCETCTLRTDGSACDECWPSMYHPEPGEFPEIIKDIGALVICVAASVIQDELDKRLAEEAEAVGKPTCDNCQEFSPGNMDSPDPCGDDCWGGDLENLDDAKEVIKEKVFEETRDARQCPYFKPKPPEEPEKCGAIGCWNHPCELEAGHDSDHCHENVGSTVTWWNDQDAEEWCPKCGMPLESPPPRIHTNAVCNCNTPTQPRGPSHSQYRYQ